MIKTKHYRTLIDYTVYTIICNVLHFCFLCWIRSEELCFYRNVSKKNNRYHLKIMPNWLTCPLPASQYHSSWPTNVQYFILYLKRVILSNLNARLYIYTVKASYKLYYKTSLTTFNIKLIQFALYMLFFQ